MDPAARNLPVPLQFQGATRHHVRHERDGRAETGKLAERAPLRQIADQVRGWVETAEPLHDARDQVTLAAGDTAARFTGRAVTVELPEGLTIRVLPLTAGDAELLTATARGTALPAISEGLSRAIELLSGQDGDLIAAMRTVTKVRRLFTGAATRTAGRQASRTITELHADLFAADVPSRLIEASGALDRLPTAVVGPSAALDRETGIADRLTALGAAHAMLRADCWGRRRSTGSKTPPPSGCCSARSPMPAYAPSATCSTTGTGSGSCRGSARCRRPGSAGPRRPC